MVALDRDGKALKIKFTGSVGYYFTFVWTGQEEWSAALLQKDLQHQFHEAVEGARREAYEQGWSDAKSKRRKQENFSPCLES